MKKFFVIFAIFALVFLIGCGDSNITKDGCTIGKSFGTHSLTRKDVAQTCVKEIAAALFPECGWQSSEESASDHIAKLQRFEVTFGSECKDKNGEQTVECPDFVPKSLKLTKLSGCEVYSIDPHTNCIAPCANLYFSTDNNFFRTVFAGSGYSQDDNSYDFIKSSGEGGVSLESKFKIGVNKAIFSWSEKGADGTESKKEISVEMVIVDPDKCKDREGKQYNEGDLIPEKCGILVCEGTGWEIYYDHWTECRACRLDESETKYWGCYDDSRVEWCNCVKNEETSKELGEEWGKWSCIDRADLQCPPRIEECEDSEGRIYQHNDKIASECDYVYCTYNGWRPTGERECNFSCTNFIGEKQSWVCADGVTEVDWCECVEDEEGGGIFTCIERADLNCPNGK